MRRIPIDPRQSLADLAAAVPSDLAAQPFLFERRGHDWKWQSFAMFREALRREVPPDSREVPREVPADSGPSGAEAAVGTLAAVWLAGLQPLPAGRRDIVVWTSASAGLGGASHDFQIVDSRGTWGEVLRWSLASGAAILLEPSPEDLPSTLAWARPTVLVGVAGECADSIETLLRWSGSPERAIRRRGPLGRIRGVFLTVEPSREEIARLRSLTGVPVVSPTLTAPAR